MELHPFYRQLERKYQGIIEKRLRDFSEVTVDVDMNVIRGVTRFLQGKTENFKKLELPHESPEVIMLILRNISTNAVLTVEEAKKLRDVMEKVGERCNRPTVFNNHGLIEEIFTFYEKRQLPHHLALRICTNLTPQSQAQLLKEAGNKLNKLLTLFLKKSCQGANVEPETDFQDNPQPNLMESMIEKILASPSGRSLLAEKLYKKTKNPVISLLIKKMEGQDDKT